MALVTRIFRSGETSFTVPVGVTNLSFVGVQGKGGNGTITDGSAGGQHGGGGGGVFASFQNFPVTPGDQFSLIFDSDYVYIMDADGIELVYAQGGNDAYQGNPGGRGEDWGFRSDFYGFSSPYNIFAAIGGDGGLGTPIGGGGGAGGPNGEGAKGGAGGGLDGNIGGGGGGADGGSRGYNPAGGLNRYNNSGAGSGGRGGDAENNTGNGFAGTYEQYWIDNSGGPNNGIGVGPGGGSGGSATNDEGENSYYSANAPYGGGGGGGQNPYNTGSQGGPGYIVIQWEEPSNTITTPWTNPQTAATYPNSQNVTTWNNTTNVLTSDYYYAKQYGPVDAFNGGYIFAEQFGFAIPPTSIIQGIEVRIQRHALNEITGEPATATYDTSVQIYTPSAGGGTDHATPFPWTGNREYVSYGGPTDLWGYTITPADVNSNQFGISFAVRCASDEVALVDNMQMRVIYEPLPAINGDCSSDLGGLTASATGVFVNRGQTNKTLDALTSTGTSRVYTMLTRVFLPGEYSWTVPPGVTYVNVLGAQGAGGRGAVADNTVSTTRSGGSSGGFSTRPNIAVTPGQNIDLRVAGIETRGVNKGLTYFLNTSIVSASSASDTVAGATVISSRGGIGTGSTARAGTNAGVVSGATLTGGAGGGSGAPGPDGSAQAGRAGSGANSGGGGAANGAYGNTPTVGVTAQGGNGGQGLKYNESLGYSQISAGGLGAKSDTDATAGEPDTGSGGGGGINNGSRQASRDGSPGTFKKLWTDNSGGPNHGLSVGPGGGGGGATGQDYNGKGGAGMYGSGSGGGYTESDPGSGYIVISYELTPSSGIGQVNFTDLSTSTDSKLYIKSISTNGFQGVAGSAQGALLLQSQSNDYMQDMTGFGVSKVTIMGTSQMYFNSMSGIGTSGVLGKAASDVVLTGLQSDGYGSSPKRSVSSLFFDDMTGTSAAELGNAPASGSLTNFMVPMQAPSTAKLLLSGYAGIGMGAMSTQNALGILLITGNSIGSMGDLMTDAIGRLLAKSDLTAAFNGMGLTAQSKLILSSAGIMGLNDLSGSSEGTLSLKSYAFINLGDLSTDTQGKLKLASNANIDLGSLSLSTTSKLLINSSGVLGLGDLNVFADSKLRLASNSQIVFGDLSASAQSKLRLAAFSDFPLGGLSTVADAKIYLKSNGVVLLNGMSALGDGRVLIASSGNISFGGVELVADSDLLLRSNSQMTIGGLNLTTDAKLLLKAISENNLGNLQLLSTSRLTFIVFTPRSRSVTIPNEKRTVRVTE